MLWFKAFFRLHRKMLLVRLVLYRFSVKIFIRVRFPFAVWALQLHRTFHPGENHNEITTDQKKIWANGLHTHTFWIYFVSPQRYLRWFASVCVYTDWNLNKRGINHHSIKPIFFEGFATACLQKRSILLKMVIIVFGTKLVLRKAIDRRI